MKYQSGDIVIANISNEQKIAYIISHRMWDNMDKINLNVGDLLYTKDGICIYIQQVEYTDEFNEGGKIIKYITVIVLNGKQEGRTSWREEQDLLDYIEEGVYTYLAVKE